MRYRQYIRVSSKKQLRGASLEEQERANAGRVSQLGGTVEHTYTEAGRSAFTERLDKRPAFQQMLIDARARRFDALVVYDLSRFSRQAAVSLTVAADLERLGITVISATEYFDRTTAAGRMTYTMLAAAAQFKSDHLSERMRAVRRSTAERGLLPGPVPVGYERRDGRLFATPAAEAVKLAFQLYCTGDYGSHRITDAMNATGHTMPDGSPFKATAVDELLHCPVYAGFVPCSGTLYPGTHEPLIDAATWERAQAVAQARARRRPDATPRYPLLAGLAVCAGCGAPMWSKGGDYPGYVCSAHLTRAHGVSPDVVCSGMRSHGPQIDQMVCGLLAGLALAPGLVEQARAMIEQQTPPTVAPVRALDAALKKLKADFLADVISAVEYESQRAALLAQPVPTPAPARAPVDSAAVLRLVGDLPTLLVEASPQHRRAVVKELLSEVWIGRRRVIAVRPTRAAAALGAAAAAYGDFNLVASSWAGWASGIGAYTKVKTVWMRAA